MFYKRLPKWGWRRSLMELYLVVSKQTALRPCPSSGTLGCDVYSMIPWHKWWVGSLWEIQPRPCWSTEKYDLPILCVYSRWNSQKPQTGTKLFPKLFKMPIWLIQPWWVTEIDTHLSLTHTIYAITNPKLIFLNYYFLTFYFYYIPVIICAQNTLSLFEREKNPFVYCVRISSPGSESSRRGWQPHKQLVISGLTGLLMHAAAPYQSHWWSNDPNPPALSPPSLFRSRQEKGHELFFLSFRF